MKVKRPANISDVAKRAKVSTATVSRAFTQPDMVRRDKLARIKEAVAELGYVRNGAARALGSMRTMTIGAIVPRLDLAIFSGVIQALQTELVMAGYQLIVSSHEYNPLVEESNFRSLLERGVDAVVLVGTEHTEGIFKLLRETRLPHIFTWSFDKNFNSVGVDNRKAGRLAAEHLLQLGHRRFGVLTAKLPFNSRLKDRIAGIQDALNENGVNLDPSCIIEQSFGLSGGRDGFRALASLAELPSAIIGTNDLFCIGAIFEAQSRGLSVPRELSVVGIGDLELASHVSPGLTTVRIPSSEIGQQTAKLILGELSGTKKISSVELPISVVVRNSTTRFKK